MKMNTFRIFLNLLFCIIIAGMVQAQNYVTTYAGTGSSGFVNGDTSIASFNQPFGICIDATGNIYLADAGNNCIRKIGIDGQVSTYAGTGQSGYLDGPADQAKFKQPINICMDDSGNMYVSDFLNQRIRKISSDMIVTTIAGNGDDGYLDGPAMDAMFNYPRGICLDDTGNLYIGDSWNHRIRKISTDGMVSTWAGGGTSIGVQSDGGYVDASDTAARFWTPCEVSIDQTGHIFVADAYNHRIRVISPNRIVTTVAGSGDIGPDGGGFMNGPNSSAMFKVPTACTVTTDGSIFVGDGSNQRVRRIGTDNMVYTFAGSGEEGFDNGPDSLATFDFPRGSVYDYTLNRLYVVDFNNHAVRIIHLESGVGVNDIPSNLDNLRAFPNPFNEGITIEYSINEKAHVNVSLFDQQGKQLGIITDETKNPGTHSVTWDALGFPAGTYYCVVKAGSNLISNMIVKID